MSETASKVPVPSKRSERQQNASSVSSPPDDAVSGRHSSDSSASQQQSGASSNMDGEGKLTCLKTSLSDYSQYSPLSRILEAPSPPATPKVAVESPMRKFSDTAAANEVAGSDDWKEDQPRLLKLSRIDSRMRATMSEQVSDLTWLIISF